MSTLPMLAKAARTKDLSSDALVLADLLGLLRDLVAPVLGPKAYRAAYGPLRAPIQPCP